MKPIKKAVIPVAGMGTRFLPATKALPKELLPIVDKPVIQYIVEEAVASGIEEIIFITNERKRAIEQHFTRNESLERILEEKEKVVQLEAVRKTTGLAKFVYVPQSEPLGLGHAVLQAKDLIGDEPFVVFGGDDVVEGAPAAKELIETYEKYGGSVIGVMEVPKENCDRYGCVALSHDMGDAVYEIVDIVEKPPVDEAPSNLAAGGRWLLTPAIFDHLEETEPGAGGEIQLTDAIKSLMKEEKTYSKTYSGIYRDCGNITEYAKAVITFSLKDTVIGPALREYIQGLNL